MPVKTYDPKQVIMTVNGVPMSGFADGTFIRVTRLNDAYVSVSGADGETSRSKSNDKRGECALTLSQTSMSNDILSAIAIADEKLNAGVAVIAIKDIAGLSTYFSGAGWIRKIPDAEYGKEITNREWMFELADMDVFVGGIAV